MKTLVLGIGNPILQNDSVGLRVADELEKTIVHPDVDIDTAYTGGLNLVDCMRGFEKVILIDAVKDEQAVGTVSRFTLASLPMGHSNNLHDCSLQEALQFSKALGDSLPREVVIIGVSIPMPEEFGEDLCPAAQEAIPRAVAMVLAELPNMMRRSS